MWGLAGRSLWMQHRALDAEWHSQQQGLALHQQSLRAAQTQHTSKLQQRAALLQRWAAAARAEDWTLVQAEVSAESLWLVMDTHWAQWWAWWAQWQNDRYLPQLAMLAMHALDEANDGMVDDQAPVRIEASLLPAAADRSAPIDWEPVLLASDPFAPHPVPASLWVSADPLSQVTLEALSVLAALRHEGHWQVLIRCPQQRLHRRGIGDRLGLERMVIQSIDQRRLTLSEADTGALIDMALPGAAGTVRVAVR